MPLGALWLVGYACAGEPQTPAKREAGVEKSNTFGKKFKGIFHGSKRSSGPPVKE